MADDVVYVNIAEGSKRVMNNLKLYVKLLGKFKEDTNMNDLETALTAGDLPKAQSSAHTLKGLAANLSLAELYKFSLETETQIKAASVNPDQAAKLRGVYDKTMAEVEKVIAQNG